MNSRSSRATRWDSVRERDSLSRLPVDMACHYFFGGGTGMFLRFPGRLFLSYASICNDSTLPILSLFSPLPLAISLAIPLLIPIHIFSHHHNLPPTPL